MQLRILFLTFFFFFSLYPKAQAPSYPKNYFRNPLAIPMKLAANFGELRPDHWHMGLDIRTNQKENLPVYAAANGYIAHIGIRPGSFGRFIIINHPNGLSTLYGHLNDFYPELEKYVTAEQYRRERWDIEIDFTKEKFPLTKGQLIAYSGNTGGSQGPHVHFEIFDTRTEKRFNPLLFGLPIQDNVPPSLVKLALYDRRYSVYEQNSQFFWLKSTDSGYNIPKLPVVKTSSTKLSFAIQAFDRMTGSTNPNGIYAATLFFDGSPVIGFVLDSIDYDETAYVNAHIDYQEKYNGGPFLQHLSQLPGERSGVYHLLNGNGVIDLVDTAIHNVRIEVKDANNNVTRLSFLLQYDDRVPARSSSIVHHDPFIPNRSNELKKSDFEMYLPEACLYDTVQPVYFRNSLAYPNAVSAMHQVNDASFPLHELVTVRIKPDKSIPDVWKDKLVMQRSYRGNSIRRIEWQDGWMVAKFGDFGNFQVFADQVAPQFNELGTGDTIDLSPQTRISITPTDNYGVLKNFRAELDGQWIRFTNDKGRTWLYTFDERCPFGIHQLKVSVQDLVGNITTKTWWFKRYPYTPPKKKVVKKKTSNKKQGTSSKKQGTRRK